MRRAGSRTPRNRRIRKRRARWAAASEHGRTAAQRLAWLTRARTRMIDLAVVHYHLLPGGVTSVIRDGLRAILEHRPGLLRSIRLIAGRTEGVEALRCSLHAAAVDAGADTVVRATVDPLLDYGVRGSANPDELELRRGQRPGCGLVDPQPSRGQERPVHAGVAARRGTRRHARPAADPRLPGVRQDRGIPTGTRRRRDRPVSVRTPSSLRGHQSPRPHGAGGRRASRTGTCTCCGTPLRPVRSKSGARARRR